FLESVSCDMVVLSWLFPRAAFWLLDRDGIRGHFGETLIKPPDLDEDEDEEHDEPEPPKGIGPGVEVPDRHIYCLNLNDSNKPDVFIEEIRRINAECRQRHEAKQAAEARSHPAIVSLGLPNSTPAETNGTARFAPEQLLAAPGRRWYPVI